MKPLLIFVADSECAGTLRGFFERQNFHTSLGCGPIELDGVAFNSEQDIRVHPEHDPGMYTDPHTVLQAERKNFQYALLILDEAWEGSPPAAKNSVRHRRLGADTGILGAPAIRGHPHPTGIGGMDLAAKPQRR